MSSNIENVEIDRYDFGQIMINNVELRGKLGTKKKFLNMPNREVSGDNKEYREMLLVTQFLSDGIGCDIR